MPKYLIKQYETTINVYEVESDNMLEALLDFRLGSSGDFVGHESFEPEANNHIGVSFESLPSDITREDLDVIRSEFNTDRNSDFLESIYHIEEAKE